ncbi:MAG: divalent-cation tolerance protein CutA [bacterium]
MKPDRTSPGDPLVVFTTFPDVEAAERLARRLVSSRLAACVQVLGPVSSNYRWKGRVERSREWLCLAKTSRLGYPALERAILQDHPYDTPEVVAVPIVAGSDAYLGWLAAALEPRPARAR